jgi:hypothetical protein
MTSKNCKEKKNTQNAHPMSKLALSVGRVNCEKSKKSLQGTFVKNG